MPYLTPNRKKPAAHQGQITKVLERVERTDSKEGKQKYQKRMGVVEPVFANITVHKRLDYFTLRGRTKVDAQWKRFCTVHNIGKLVKYANVG